MCITCATLSKLIASLHKFSLLYNPWKIFEKQLCLAAYWRWLESSLFFYKIKAYCLKSTEVIFNGATAQTFSMVASSLLWLIAQFSWWRRKKKSLQKVTWTWEQQTLMRFVVSLWMVLVFLLFIPVIWTYRSTLSSQQEKNKKQEWWNFCFVWSVFKLY